MNKIDCGMKACGVQALIADLLRQGPTRRGALRRLRMGADGGIDACVAGEAFAARRDYACATLV
jgi:hypothetical protein